MIERRCLERRFLLQPSPVVNQTFDYMLAISSERFSMGLIGDVAMGNHHHVAANDVLGQHPKFTQFFHAHLAKALNGYLRRSDVFWEGTQPAVTELADAEAVLDAVAYTLANPVAAGLVEHGWQWIGARSEPDSVLRRVLVRKPKLPYFRGPKWPEVVELRYRVPLTHAHLSPAEWAAVLAERTAAMEARAREAVKAAGRSFVGPEALRRRRWPERATSAAGRRRVLKPLVKARDSLRRLAVLTRIATFRRDYREALAAFAAGVRDVVFPMGTYQMVERYAVACRPPP